MEQKNERLEDWASNRKDHMKDMSLFQRLKWYLTYYWLQIGLVVVAVLIAAYFIWSATLGKTETWLNVAMVNVDVYTEELEQVQEELAEQNDINLKKEEISFDTGYLLDEDSEDVSQNNITFYTKLEAVYVAGNLDVFMAPEDVCSMLLEKGFYFVDLEDLLGTDFISRFEESQLLWSVNDEGEEYICGVSVAGSKFEDQTGMVMEDPYVLIPGTVSNEENARIFLEYMFDQVTD